MSDHAIKAENISKAYRIGLKEKRHDTLGAAMAAWARSPLKKFKQLRSLANFNNQEDADIYWALKDISFEVKKGEVLGIIGKNGAGKSTLLKIISRITEPTSGRIEIYGRIASLLEVGTGFNPELTGRENVYLNGTILGMTKREIDLKFDEIIDFSGVEKFLDTPVKRYSSGMKVRLAFAVAAHLDPEILIIDEVLAVGDAEFQKKCLGKMEDISKGQGRTVLFVSHNMAAIQSLCAKCIYLKDGQIFAGPDDTQLILNKYLQSLETSLLEVPLKERSDREGEGEMRITDIKILNDHGENNSNLISGQRISFVVDYVNMKPDFDEAPLEISLSISRKNEHLITVVSTKYLNSPVKNTPDRKSISFLIDSLPLMTGSYSINVMIRKNDVIQDWIREAKFFEVENGDYYKTGLNIPESHKGVYFNYIIN